MNEHDETRTALRDMLDRTEPLFALQPPAQVRAQARRQRRRHVVVLAAAGVLTIGAAAAGLSQLGVIDTENQTQAWSSSTNGSTPPEEVAATLERMGEESVPDGTWSDVRVDALDAQNNPIEGDARSMATRWKATFEAKDGRELRIIAINETPLPADQLRQNCAGELKAEYVSTCTVQATDSSVWQSIERAGQLTGTGVESGWAVATPAQWDAAGDGLFFLRQVIGRSSDGTTLYVSEAVRSPSLAEARTRWIISPEQLTSLATASGLRLPSATSQCAYIVPDSTEQRKCE